MSVYLILLLYVCILNSALAGTCGNRTHPERFRRPTQVLKTRKHTSHFSAPISFLFILQRRRGRKISAAARRSLFLIIRHLPSFLQTLFYPQPQRYTQCRNETSSFQPYVPLSAEGIVFTYKRHSRIRRNRRSTGRLRRSRDCTEDLPHTVLHSSCCQMTPDSHT